MEHDELSRFLCTVFKGVMIVAGIVSILGVVAIVIALIVGIRAAF
jgi:hypothetical protein